MRKVSTIAFGCAVLAIGGLLYAQSNDKTQSNDSKVNVSGAKTAARGSGVAKNGGKAKLPLAVTPEREAAVLTFVQRNHAELVDLLATLKTSQPEEYDRAIKEIFRTTERLAQIQERDPLQYELEVTAWTAQSRVQLLAAKLKMGSSDDLMKQLREALKSQNDTKLALLKHERQKFADRVAKIDSDIARFENDSEQTIDRQMKLLTQAVAEGRPTKLGPKNAARPAKKNDTKPAQ